MAVARHSQLALPKIPVSFVPIAPQSMAEELLSLCIPTRNRCKRLARLLERLEDEISRHHISVETLRVYVWDNASTDSTHATAKGFLGRFRNLTYSRHPEDIGAGANFRWCAEQAPGNYCWIFGDDDLVKPGRLPYIVEILRQHRPALFINNRGSDESAIKGLPILFPSFQAFAAACVRVNPCMLLTHTLITANIFDRSRFDHAFASTMRSTPYSHMYGLVSGLAKSPGGVYLTDRQTIAVRDSSADPVDGVTWFDLDGAWQDYLRWMKTLFDLPELRPEAIVQYRRLSLWHEFRANPVRFCRRYRESLLNPRAYKTVWKLLRPSGRS
jgi:glycosyltransferase involved in cell wall biosynthesis